MKYTVKKATGNNGAVEGWAVFAGKKAISELFTDEAVAQRCAAVKSAWWYMDQATACKQAWEAAGGENMMGGVDGDWDGDWGDLTC